MQLLHFMYCPTKMTIGRIFIWIFFSTLIAQCIAFGQGEVKQNDDGRSGTISFKPPDLSDEEAQSQHMPSTFKCDACKILAYQFAEHFKKANEKHKSLQGKLPESVIIDTVETVCRYPFEDYGMKEVDGVKRLSGPGTDIADLPGIMQGGGKWPPRFHQLCDSYTGEVDEEALYAAYQASTLEKTLCFDKSSRELGACAVKTDGKPKQKGKKKQQKATTAEKKKPKKSKSREEEL